LAIRPYSANACPSGVEWAFAAEHPQPVVGPDLVGDQGTGDAEHVRPVHDHLVQVHPVAGQRLQRPVRARLDPGQRRAPEPLVVQVLETGAEVVAEDLEDAEDDVGVYMHRVK
jgi:hypothetical protein